MMIQFLSFPECPNAPAARTALERAMASIGLTDAIEEVDTSSSRTPEGLRDWGSPTILLDAKDVGEEAEPTGAGCRLYRGEDGELQGTLPEALLRSALIRALKSPGHRPPVLGVLN